jgi:predicted nucleic acid-binding protein
MEGIDEMVRSVDKGDAILITSAITRIEVLDSTLTDAQRAKFRQAIGRKSIQSLACSMRVADKAHELRDFYQAKGQKLQTPDAIHLATAIIYGADILYTFDGIAKDKPQKNMKFLPLNGDVAGHGLAIQIPNGRLSLFPGIASPTQ